jgi:hypothetical protein
MPATEAIATNPTARPRALGRPDAALRDAHEDISIPPNQ